MCKNTDKPLFAAGFGVQLLAHYCAVGQREINVVNGDERGGDLSKLKNTDISLCANEDDVFLNNETGDFYSF